MQDNLFHKNAIPRIRPLGLRRPDAGMAFRQFHLGGHGLLPGYANRSGKLIDRSIALAGVRVCEPFTAWLSVTRDVAAPTP